MKRVLVTGATGFVGRTLCDTLARAGYVVRAALRDDKPSSQSIAEKVVVGDITSRTQWTGALVAVDAVVHLAARAHVLHDSPSNADLYIETNARGTLCLAQAAARAGVCRFIFLSSIKVNGEQTVDHAYTALDEPAPVDTYGSSKWLAEQSLAEIGGVTDMQIATIRPPLVYGPGVRANFLRLMRWVDRRIPLPLGAVRNQRSLVSVWNLCDLVRVLLEREHAPSRTWMVSDGEDLSTPELIRRMALAMNRPARLPSVPVPVLRTAGRLLGKQAEVHRLCSSLTVDIATTRAELGWSPPVSVDEALRRTVQWYVNEERKLGN